MINRQATGFVCVVPSSGHTTFPGGPRMSLARFMASSVPPTLVRGRLEGFHSVGRARGEQTSLSVRRVGFPGNARRWSLLILGVRALG
jgi:hypothetical protein